MQVFQPRWVGESGLQKHAMHKTCERVSSGSPLILASSSKYRRELLERLHLDFEIAAPDVDERPLGGEAPPSMALRLACAKARAVQARHPTALIIGCDQVAVVEGTLLHKPGTFENAARQLKVMRGKTVSFHTGLCLLNARSTRIQSEVVTMVVHMRAYDDAEIERYLQAEEPYDCAGSARIEGLGITLVSRIEGDDPNALIGLPLISLCNMLHAEGLKLP